MRRIVTLVGCFVLALALTSAARADLTAEFWENVKSYGLTPGVDKIRVVFVSSGTITATSGVWNDYDVFGDAQAGAGLITGTLVKDFANPDPEIGMQSPEWRPLVTTNNNLSNPVWQWLNDSEAPVFNTLGQRVATSGLAMLSGLDTPILYDQSGDDQTWESSVAVWTGTDADGTPFELTGSLQPSFQLGYTGDVPNPDHSIIGNGGAIDSDWLTAAVSRHTSGLTVDGFVASSFTDIGRSIYVMSGEITVVPEPSTILLWLGMAGIAGVVFWRKRRS